MGIFNTYSMAIIITSPQNLEYGFLLFEGGVAWLSENAYLT